MALDLSSPLQRILEVLQLPALTAAGLQGASTGVPESVGPQVSGWVALAGQRLLTRTGRLAQWEARYWVEFGYAVEGAEATAEVVLAAVLTAFTRAMLAERLTDLNGTADSVELDLSLANDPQYLTMAGQEFRVLPCIVLVTQQENY